MLTVRKSRRVPSSRSYKDYGADTLKMALTQVRRGKISQRKAGAKYGISPSTLSNKINGRHPGTVGRQQKISAERESDIATAIDVLVNFKVPLTRDEVRGFVKSYIDALEDPVLIFENDNLPGKDWLKGFMQRNDMTLRKACNVSAARAKVNAESLNAYFDELAKELEGIPPSNIFNYDETNISDDPGAQVVVCRRGLRRVDRLMEHSHSSTSIMFCGSASGEYLPPFVVYKVHSETVYSEWVKNGPKNAIYGATQSGWFDKRTFREWFMHCFLPKRFAIDNDSPVVIIGDNLGSHFDIEVIRACSKYDIRFITMPPNSTHLCQPLDLAVFKTLKLEWRRILDFWRRSTRIQGSIPKPQIPALLKKLCCKLNAAHLISGFRGSGIYPCDRSPVLTRLSVGKAKVLSRPLTNKALTDCLTGLLEDRCGPPAANTSRKRGKQLRHMPGRRILVQEDWKQNHCFQCEGQYEPDSSRVWIGSNHCQNWFHLECSGLEYDEDGYHDLDIEALEFQCPEH